MTPFLTTKLRQAWRCLRETDLAGARAEVEEALAAGEDHVSLHSLLAEIARREGRAADAAALAREALDRYGPDAVAASVLGRLALEANRPRDALPYLQDAYRLLPNAYAAEAVLDALVALEDFDAADRFLAEALERMPGDARLLKRAARHHDRRGRPAEALRALEELLRIDPGDDGARRMQIEIKSAGRSPEAVGTLLGIGDRGRDPHLRGLYARKLRAAGDFAGAARQFAEAADLAPENDYFRKQAGFAFAKARLDDEAIAFLQPLFLAEPQDRYVRSALLAALRRRGGPPAVAAAIDEALARHPDKAFLHGIRKKYGS